MELKFLSSDDLATFFKFQTEDGRSLVSLVKNFQLIQSLNYGSRLQEWNSKEKFERFEFLFLRTLES